MVQDKDLVQKSIQNLKNHIKEIHSNLPNLKIFENVGEHPYVIKFTSFNDYDISLTLQISNDFNLSKSTVVITQQKKQNEKQLNSFEDVLVKKIQELDSKNDKFLVKFFEKAFDYAEKNFEKYQNNTETSPKNKKKEKKNVKNKSDDESDVTSKKTSMKTAGDVVNRIQWDEEINKDFIIVGYMDRFLGLKECMFNTFDWGDIVLAEYGALAIPEHRISYFKYKDEIIWDKKNRLDNIFGSTGSGITIRDVVQRLENIEFKPSISESEPTNKVGRHGDNNVVEKIEPNFFISVPVNSFKVKMNFDQFTSELLEFNEEVESFLVPESSMHLTLCTLRIENDQEMQNVKDVMNNLLLNNEFKQNSSVSLKFKGIGEFYQKVLYSKCESNELDKLKNIKRIVLEKLNESNINTAGNYYDFVPHLTVFKIKNNMNNSNMNVDDFVSKIIWKRYENFEFGDEIVNEIQLCKMVNVFVNKIYPVEHSVNF